MKRPGCPAVDESGLCGAAPDVGELCRKHYMRQRRRKTFFGRQPKAIEDGSPVSFTLEHSDRARLEKRAEREGVSLGTLLRKAVRLFLDET